MAMLFDKTKIGINKDKLELINRRRRQILVHSYLYYNMNTNLISDYTFDIWCKELVQLHKDNPNETLQAVFPKAFKNWTGFTGFDLFKEDKEATSWAYQKANYLKTICLQNK